VILEEANLSEFRGSAADAGDTPAALRQRGLERLEAKAFEEAVTLLSRARALDPEEPRIPLELGVALQGARRHAEALDLFEQALKARPDDPSPLPRASLSLLALGKTEAARQAASEACARAPGLPQAHLALGQALLALKEPKRAEEDAWVLLGVARERLGAIARAEAALREALRIAPGHAAASARLASLRRVGETAPPTAKTGLTAWRPTSPAAAVGLAVEYLARKPAFARLPFGEWSQVLFFQVARTHYFFVVNDEQRILGFLGWALTQQPLADLWVEGQLPLRNEECLDGECVIVNAWAADTPAVSDFILDAMRKLFANKRAVYYKRRYPDGRSRATRLKVPRRKPTAATEPLPA
jgi:tetratricopeptide (TPR) repeat protein